MAEILENISRVNLRMRRGPVVVGDVLYAAGGVCGPRLQQDYQLVVVHEGELDLKIDQEQLHVSAGQAVLLSPHHREHFIFSRQSETHHSWCAIRPDAIPLKIRKQLRHHRGPLPFVGRMAALLETIRRAAVSDNEPLRDGFYLGLGLGLLCDFALAVEETISPPTHDEKILRHLDHFICNKFAGPLTLTELAKAACVSKQHLLRLCRERKIATPIKQLFQRRLEAAADLLMSTGLSIGEISEKCGFANAFHFSRKFKQAYGRSPLAWRKYLWAKGKTANTER